MSIEALPNKLLLQIFNHLSWKELRSNLSLVNKRWYRVIGMHCMADKATLHLSKPDSKRSKNWDDICIPLEVLCGSSREYSKFSCSMRSLKNELLIDGRFATVLQYCHQRWKMHTLRIMAHYAQFIAFLQHHRNLLNDVIKINILVIDISPPDGLRHDDEALHHTFFMLPMNNIQKMDFEHRQISNNYQSPTYVLALITPNLETLNIQRCVIRNNVRIELHECPKLRSIYMFSRKPLRGAFVPDPVELENISSHQTPLFSKIKLIGVSVATTFAAIFSNLRNIFLAYVRVDPTDHALTCENLTELTVHSLILQKPLKLIAPQLRSLNCDMDMLKLLHLQDAIHADQLVIDMRYPSLGRSMEMANPAGLSHFRKLLLKPTQCYCYDAIWFAFLWSHLEGIRELQVRNIFPQDHLSRLRDVLMHFPQLSSLRLQGMVIPSDMQYLPTNIKIVSIEDCSVDGNSVHFSPNVECVWVHKLWNNNEDSGNSDIDSMHLLPQDKFTPLESKIGRINHGRRLTYSTRNTS
ncbi:uncharacterized protein LOC134221758 [Armigeres subalbatus]|uniref:uncharacterized protein LOC134221758 n=1 Tax=Armigeres subalbatus TaxID=124917 RepID=UPI002ED559A0